MKEGAGSTPQQGQTVTVHCTGYGKDTDLNKVFWSTKDPGQKPFSFQIGVGQVIKGTFHRIRICISFEYEYSKK